MSIRHQPRSRHGRRPRAVLCIDGIVASRLLREAERRGIGVSWLGHCILATFYNVSIVRPESIKAKRTTKRPRNGSR